jgi:hypothetical protein
LDITPWEGLLTAVRIAAGRVAFIESKLGTAYSDRQLEPPGAAGEATDGLAGGSDFGRASRTGEGGDNLHFWVRQAEFWHDRLARVCKLAIDAGVAERLVRQLELEAHSMVTAANAGLDAAGIEGHQREVLLRAMSTKLLELEAADDVADADDVAG